LVIPVASADPGASLGVFVAGVSPNRALDEGYRSFHELLAAQVSVALRNARAYEDERRRPRGWPRSIVRKRRFSATES
jgi:GAF domain-containing protein